MWWARKGYAFLLMAIAVFSACTKPAVHYLRPIPMVTRESRELFGCRINGIPFSPQAADSSSMGTCSYRKAYDTRTGFVFRLNGDRHKSACEFATITIVLDSVAVERDATFKLGSPGPKKNYATYFIVKECGDTGEEMTTNDDLFGYVAFDRVDKEKKIVTGSFHFHVKDKNGNLYRMSDGVFDRHYTD